MDNLCQMNVSQDNLNGIDIRLGTVKQHLHKDQSTNLKIASLIIQISILIFLIIFVVIIGWLAVKVNDVYIPLIEKEVIMLNTFFSKLSINLEEISRDMKVVARFFNRTNTAFP